ncbi:MAG: hypothetical protein MAG551_02664 [Candidatus Scalindua arabica]|uniref:Uncharacterized protein n=1 Tax=Candidatus Scalindua arabica TaxID=1127984 RepID=A0A942A3Z3_9BACT|nr:hypothetical protein [Candidatus Scalindua arabica]
MGAFKLEEVTKFSEENVVSTNLYDSQKVCTNFLCMEEGQSALEDTKEQKVIIVINSGSGSVVTDDGEQDIEEGTFILCERGESRLLKAKSKLTALVNSIP